MQGPAPDPAPPSNPEAAAGCIANVVADAQAAWAADAEHLDDTHAVVEAEQTQRLGDLDGDGRRCAG